MPTDLVHAVNFLQNAYTIVLGLALTEGFKQYIPDGDRNIDLKRFVPLVGFLFLLFPFFHGMSRYLYTTYLSKNAAPHDVAASLMFDGVMFMLMAGCFFAMSRSFSSNNWKRYYKSLSLLLLVDSIWICFVSWKGAPVITWLVLNAVLAATMAGMFYAFRSSRCSPWPTRVCSATVCATTIASYVIMRDFYFP